MAAHGGKGLTIREALKVGRAQTMPKIDAALNREVLNVVRQTESDAVADIVYSTPTSGFYVRRGDGKRAGHGGGVGDPENMVIEGGSAKNGRMAVINETEPNPFLNGVNGDRATVNKNLIHVIEYGFGRAGDPGYDYWESPKPRRFVAETRKRLRENKAHVAAMEKGLKRQGVKVEK